MNGEVLKDRRKIWEDVGESKSEWKEGPKIKKATREKEKLDNKIKDILKAKKLSNMRRQKT